MTEQVSRTGFDEQQTAPPSPDEQTLGFQPVEHFVTGGVDRGQQGDRTTVLGHPERLTLRDAPQVDAEVLAQLAHSDIIHVGHRLSCSTW